jgi:hypothetical protein
MATKSKAKRAEPPLVRIDNWPSLLEAELQARIARPFAWGEQDCCMFAAAMGEAMTRRNLARGLRYKGQLGAVRLLKRYGGVEGLMEHLAGRYGLAECKGVLYARRGDVCLLKLPDGEGLGVCVGANVAGAGPLGVVLVPLPQARRAWRIG